MLCAFCSGVEDRHPSRNEGEAEGASLRGRRRRRLGSINPENRRAKGKKGRTIGASGGIRGPAERWRRGAGADGAGLGGAKTHRGLSWRGEAPSAWEPERQRELPEQSSGRRRLQRWSVRLGPAWEAGDRHAVHGGYERWPPELGSPAPWAAGLSPGRSPIALGLRYLARLAAAQGVPRQHEARLGTPGNLPYIGDMAHSSATARLEARLPKSVHALLKRAAEIQGRTLTDFVVTAAHEAAR